MQEAPGRIRAATFDFDIECIAAQAPKAKFVPNSGLTISGFLPQMSMRRMRTTAEGNSIRVMAMKLVVSSSERFEIVSIFRRVLVLPGVGVLSEVDLVSTEGRGRIKRRREKNMQSCQPECEAIVDEGGDRPDDKEGKGDREDTWVEAVKDGEPQHLKSPKDP